MARKDADDFADMLGQPYARRCADDGEVTDTGTIARVWRQGETGQFTITDERGATDWINHPDGSTKGWESGRVTMTKRELAARRLLEEGGR